jgi:hypothetical protein
VAWAFRHLLFVCGGDLDPIFLLQTLVLPWSWDSSSHGGRPSTFEEGKTKLEHTASAIIVLGHPSTCDSSMQWLPHSDTRQHDGFSPRCHPLSTRRACFGWFVSTNIFFIPLKDNIVC